MTTSPTDDFDPEFPPASPGLDDLTLDHEMATAADPESELEPSTTDQAGGRARFRSLAARLPMIATVLAVVLVVVSAVVIGLEQRNQSRELEHQTCYARAAAMAQVAAVEVAKGSPNPPDAGLFILLCDQQSGVE